MHFSFKLWRAIFEKKCAIHLQNLLKRHYFSFGKSNFNFQNSWWYFLFPSGLPDCPCVRKYLPKIYNKSNFETQRFPIRQILLFFAMLTAMHKGSSVTVRINYIIFLYLKKYSIQQDGPDKPEHRAYEWPEVEDYEYST